MTRPARALVAARPVIAAALATLLLAACASGGSTASSDTASSDGGPAFLDHFDGSHLDTSKWTTCYWWEHDGCTIETNHELERYRPSQVGVADGVLSLTATPRPSTHRGRTYRYASGMVSTGRTGDRSSDRPKFAFTYGVVQVRFRTPAGGGLWPAIWMLPASNDSLPEIDLLEQYGSDTSTAKMTLHGTGRNGDPQVERHELRTTDLAEGWHTVELRWSPGHLQWLLDGAPQFQVDGDRVPSEPMYLLVNLAVGGQAGPVPASTDFPARFLVDEVAVWTGR